MMAADQVEERMQRIVAGYREISTNPSDDLRRRLLVNWTVEEERRLWFRDSGTNPSDEPSRRLLDNWTVEERRQRIEAEYREIRTNPSDDFDCRMFQRNVNEWQFGIIGSVGTEFEGGIYHGIMQFPKEYPFKPPAITLLTENGRYKIHHKIRIKRLKDWQPSWTVRDVLDALLEGMHSYPDGKLGSVEYNKEERRDLAIKSRGPAPEYGSSERRRLIYEIHEYLLSKSPDPVPQLIPSKASNGINGGSYVINGGYVVSGNTFHATNANRVGMFDSMNAFSDEDRKCVPSLLQLLGWRKQN